MCRVWEIVKRNIRVLLLELLMEDKVATKADESRIHRNLAQDRHPGEPIEWVSEGMNHTGGVSWVISIKNC